VRADYVSFGDPNENTLFLPSSSAPSFSPARLSPEATQVLRGLSSGLRECQGTPPRVIFENPGDLVCVVVCCFVFFFFFFFFFWWGVVFMTVDKFFGRFLFYDWANSSNAPLFFF